MNGDAVYLRHIVDAAERISRYVAVGRDRFIKETHWQDAVIRQLEIIGEATKQLSLEFRANHPDVEWRRIAGLRDVLIHNYMGVDLDAVWEITQGPVPDLRQQILAMLGEEGSTEA